MGHEKFFTLIRGICTILVDYEQFLFLGEIVSQVNSNQREIFFPARLAFWVHEAVG